MLKIIILMCAIEICYSATIRFNNDLNTSAGLYKLDDSSAGDLVYSDVSEAQHQEVRERLYRQLRQYGVPSDVAHMYVPRGMTVGEFLGSDKDKINSENDENDDDSASTFDPWSIVWYIGSFGGLIAFFLVISCSEWCCLRSRAAATLAGATTPSNLSPRVPRCPPNTTRQSTTDTPPPSYHLFAPPSYELVFGDEKRKYDVFVVPVHRGGCLENPPQYYEIVPTRT